MKMTMNLEHDGQKHTEKGLFSKIRILESLINKMNVLICEEVLTSQCPSRRLATDGNPLCHFNLFLGDVSTYSSPPGPPYSSLLSTPLLYSSSCLLKVSPLGSCVWMNQCLDMTRVLFIAVITSHLLPVLVLFWVVVIQNWQVLNVLTEWIQC